MFDLPPLCRQAGMDLLQLTDMLRKVDLAGYAAYFDGILRTSLMYFMLNTFQWKDVCIMKISYAKNHWTIHQLACIYFDEFYMLVLCIDRYTI